MEANGVLLGLNNAIMVVSRVSSHGRLNITRNFGLHGCLAIYPGSKSHTLV